MLYMIKQSYRKARIRNRARGNRSMILGPLFIYYKIFTGLLDMGKDYVLDYMKSALIAASAVGLTILIFFFFPHTPLKEVAIKDFLENTVGLIVLIVVCIKFMYRFIKRKKGDTA